MELQRKIADAGESATRPRPAEMALMKPINETRTGAQNQLPLSVVAAPEIDQPLCNRTRNRRTDGSTVTKPPHSISLISRAWPSDRRSLVGTTSALPPRSGTDNDRGMPPNPRWDSKRTKARMAAGLLSEGGRWNAPRAEVTVSTGTISFIPGPLAIRTEQQADDNKRTGD